MFKRLAKRLLGKDYFRAALAWQLRRAKVFPPILIYQMGKVGSKAVEDSLAMAKLQNPLLHVHVLSEEGIRRGELSRRSEILGDAECWRNIFLRNIVSDASSPIKWKVITLVREPVARNASAFFENRDLWSDLLFAEAQKAGGGVDAHIAEFLGAFDHDRPLDWFDMEINRILDIDVYKVSFPQKDGYQIIRNNRIELLVLKLESLNKAFAPAMKEFLEIDNLELAKSNVAASKEYKTIYSDFLENLKLPDSYVEKMYSSKYARHFYTESELSRFHARWIAGSRNVS